MNDKVDFSSLICQWLIDKGWECVIRDSNRLTIHRNTPLVVECALEDDTVVLLQHDKSIPKSHARMMRRRSLPLYQENLLDNMQIAINELML